MGDSRGCRWEVRISNEDLWLKLLVAISLIATDVSSYLHMYVCLLHMYVCVCNCVKRVCVYAFMRLYVCTCICEFVPCTYISKCI